MLPLIVQFVCSSFTHAFIVEHKWMAADQINTVAYAEVTEYIMFSFIFIDSLIHSFFKETYVV